MGPFLEGKQGIIPRNKLVSRKVFTPKSVDLFFLEDTDVKAFVFCVSVLTGSPDQHSVYELSAVLIHRGISAYSGHYIAHVKDAHTGDWYKFNDEEIEKMEGKKLQLGLEEDIGKSHKQFYQHVRCSAAHFPTSACPNSKVRTTGDVGCHLGDSEKINSFICACCSSWAPSRDCEISDQKTKVH